MQRTKWNIMSRQLTNLSLPSIISVVGDLQQAGCIEHTQQLCFFFFFLQCMFMSLHSFTVLSTVVRILIRSIYILKKPIIILYLYHITVFNLFPARIQLGQLGFSKEVHLFWRKNGRGRIVFKYLKMLPVNMRQQENSDKNGMHLEIQYKYGKMSQTCHFKHFSMSKRSTSHFSKDIINHM